MKKSQKATLWLKKNPDKTVKQAAKKFDIHPSTIYLEKKRGGEELNLPAVMRFDEPEKTQSLVIIVKTDNPADLLRSLFQ